MPSALALTAALLVLGLTLGLAVARPGHVPEAVAAGGGAILLVLAGAVGPGRARLALDQLGPTVAFLAALLLIAEGCRRDGLFDAVGDVMARGADGDSQKLLAMVFVLASAVTIVLGLDATVVLLTPIVLGTAARLGTSPRTPLYACAHLANSASLLLPVSNLTNLLAFQASGVSFTRFAALMTMPTVAAVSVEWIVLRRWPRRAPAAPGPASRPGRMPAPWVGAARETAAAPKIESERRLPRFALAVLSLTLAGFGLSSVLGIDPLWVAITGALAINGPALLTRRSRPAVLVRAVEPGFLVFVLGLGVIVAAASVNGLSATVREVLPAGHTLPELLGIATASAVLANLVNNLPATLLLVPVAAGLGLGPGPVLAVLIGVNVGPNLTHVGSLATLLWRRVASAHGVEVEGLEFVRLGVLTVPPALVAATVLLWLGLQVIG